MSEDKSVDYKDTINLPKTEFPMRGKLPQTEPVTIENWESNSIYQKMIEKNSADNKFVMPDGPPYANGDIHLGHVLNKVLKDIVIKHRNMKGYRAAFIPGWDCHGLPIELKVTKKLGKKRREMTDADVRELCRKEALTWVDTQREQFKRLGVLADWDNPYLTLLPEYEAEEVRVLAKILENGKLYRGEKPVNWCPKLRTALAAAEVEYIDHVSPSIYVRFDVAEKTGPLANIDKPVGFVIWTTTPWTIPSNYAIALNEKFEYGLYDTGDSVIVLAKELAESFEKETEISLKEISVHQGSEFEGMSARHPFIDRESKIIFGHHVTLEAGTGCVHTAPAHGMDDYVVGLKYDLPVHSVVDPAGKFTSDLPEFEGVSIWDANDKICEKMKASDHLLGWSKLKHSYPHNPRTKSPLIFRATPQWFVRMDEKESDNSLRAKALHLAENEIEFVPKWGSARLKAMIENSPDWCLSRQRTWGVPIPVFYCEGCGESLCDSEIMHKVADLMESTGKGIEAYHSTSAEELVSGKACPSCGGKEFKKGNDILDVWFDSGVCHSAVQKKRGELAFPADIYLEGSDQHRGWFQTSLMSSVAAYNEAPYKALITHGFVNDADGYKMSKSKGNVIDPAKIIKDYGAEILRLWVAYEDYGQDVTIGNEMFKRISETYRRIRNTVRFMLGNLDDFDPAKDKVAFKDMPELDQWALIRLNDFIEKTNEAYDSYNFYKVYHALNNFFTVDLSATYLDILKDRLYTGKKDGLPRRASQTVILEMLETLTSAMAPILTFISEETYKYLPTSDKESVLLTDFPKPRPEWKNDQVVADFEVLLDVRSKVSKVLEEVRNEKVIGSSLDARVVLTANGKTEEVLKKYEDHLCELFIVSQLELKSGDFSVEAGKSLGEKCVRCWNYSEQTGADTDFPDICPKCVEALK